MSATFTIAGRVVSGSPSYVQTKGYGGVLKDKPNVFFAVAVPKTDPQCAAAMGVCWSEAAGFYAQNQAVMQQIQLGLEGKFAWKIDDGDAPDNAQKDGWAGCYVFKYSTTLGYPPCFDQSNMPMDPAHIKTGHYVEVLTGVEPNKVQDVGSAGIYMNPNMVRLAGYGPEIRQGPTPEQAFGAGPPQLPAGASATPVTAQQQGFPQGQPQQQPYNQGHPQPQGFTNQGGHAPGQAAPAGSDQAPSGFPAASAGAPGSQGTAFPTNAGQSVAGQPTASPNAQTAAATYPGVQPAQGFGNVRR